MLDIIHITHADRILLILTTLCSKKRKFRVMFQKVGLEGSIYRDMLVKRIINIEPSKDLVTVIEEDPTNVFDPPETQEIMKMPDSIRRFKISKVIFIGPVKENENGE